MFDSAPGVAACMRTGPYASFSKLASCCKVHSRAHPSIRAPLACQDVTICTSSMAKQLSAAKLRRCQCFVGSERKRMR